MAITPLQWWWSVEAQHLQEALDAMLPGHVLLLQLLASPALLHSSQPGLPAGMLGIQGLELDSSLHLSLAQLLFSRSLHVSLSMGQLPCLHRQQMMVCVHKL